MYYKSDMDYLELLDCRIFSWWTDSEDLKESGSFEVRNTLDVALPNQRFSQCKVRGESVSERFKRLSTVWKEKAAPLSSLTSKVMLPSYQEIIGMGWAAVPLMLRDLEVAPQHWFWALRCITGTNPASVEDAGKMHQIARAWVKWGYDNGIIWIGPHGILAAIDQLLSSPSDIPLSH
jgi:hypothetical protein